MVTGLPAKESQIFWKGYGMPKISVVVPVYNVEPYLHRCVDSILQQSFQDFELILVDDGSPDHCGAICDEYAVKDSRIHVIHQKNGGLSAARNSGIDWAFANSDSQWLTFIDSDDWIHRDFLKILLNAAEQKNASLSVCGLYWTSQYCEDVPLKKVQAMCLDPEQAFTQHYEKCIPACSKLIEKRFFKELRFPVGKQYEDAFVTHKFLFASPAVAVLQEKLYYYYNNPTSITRAKWSDRKLDSIEAHEQRLAFLEEHGYRKAYLREQEIYVEELTDKIRHLVNTREHETDHQKVLNHLRDKLRAALKKARNDGLIGWNGETMWSYFFALRTDAVWKAANLAQKVYHKIKD